MSFSFAVKGATKALAKAAVAATMAKVVEQQPVHSRDQSMVQATADLYIDSLGDELLVDKEVSVSVNGSISVTNPTAGPSGVTWANVGVSVSVVIPSIQPTVG